MLKAERRSDEVEDLMIWVSELKSHSILFLGVFEDLIQILTILHNDLGNGSGCLCAEYGPSNRRPLGLVDAASVVHQGGEGVRQHHLQMVLDLQRMMVMVMVMIITVKRRAQRASRLLSIMPWVVKDSSIGSGDPGGKINNGSRC